MKSYSRFRRKPGGETAYSSECKAGIATDFLKLLSTYDDLLFQLKVGQTVHGACEGMAPMPTERNKLVNYCSQA